MWFWKGDCILYENRETGQRDLPRLCVIGDFWKKLNDKLGIL